MEAIYRYKMNTSFYPGRSKVSSSPFLFFNFKRDAMKFNEETEAAFAEARAIMRGEIKTRKYDSVRELFDELNAEMDGE